MAMARRGSLRASDADRELIVDRLRAAAGEGRLAAHELEDRVGAALGARTYGELDVTVADLPGLPTGARKRSRSRRALALVRSHPALALVVIPVVAVVVALVAAIAAVSLVVMIALLVLGRRRAVMIGARPCRSWRRHARRAGYWA